ncbi:MAG: phage tail protein [Xanthomonadaceae bacterium]|jgi:microcystin-dependent protein|nr:phage tail protein [Xanthomonadaceae bacterium]MDE3073011.1 phage tail protein [Pseudomonadota bacterium]
MADVYIGQIMLAGFGFPPKGFAACNGQLLPINQYQALFSLLGTQYGGNGTTNFALPDLRGRVPVGAGPSADPAWQPAALVQGTAGGAESVPLQGANLPPHTHTAQASSAAGTARNPANALYAGSGSESIYAPASGPQAALNAQTVGTTGSGAPHENMQPFRVVNFNIALTGYFPSRS